MSEPPSEDHLGKLFQWLLLGQGNFWHRRSDWVNAQSLDYPLVCLGDGHPGVWKLVENIATSDQRLEVLDW